MDLNQLWRKVPPDVLNFLLRKESVRKLLLRKAEERLQRDLVLANKENQPAGLQENRYLLLQNLLHTINNALSDGGMAAGASRGLLNNLVGKVLLGREERLAPFQKEFGADPPSFLTVSPTKKCNLFCKACYASGGSSGSVNSLSFDIFSRILDEKKKLWGSYFTVISGGEPLLYRDGKKTIFTVFEAHADQYFLMYTNCMLTSKDVVRRMANLGNVTLAVSVDGFEKETDQRRGKGVFKMIVRSMENMRKAGLPFGISVTATRQNVETILKDKFTDFFFREMGALYGSIVQYMPIGRGYSMELMMTPEQRLALFKREIRMIKEFKLFLLDFCNGGPYGAGCTSAGRPGGHFYIDWNGNIAPCAFSPYSVMNIYDLYRCNKTLNDVLSSPYFTSLRQWESNYGFAQASSKVGNPMVPCLFRDHYDEAYVHVNEFGAKPMDENAAEALHDEVYRMQMTEYGKNIKLFAQKHWDAGVSAEGAAR